MDVLLQELEHTSQAQHAAAGGSSNSGTLDTEMARQEYMSHGQQVGALWQKTSVPHLKLSNAFYSRIQNLPPLEVHPLDVADKTSGLFPYKMHVPADSKRPIGLNARSKERACSPRSDDITYMEPQ